MKLVTGSVATVMYMSAYDIDRHCPRSLSQPNVTGDEGLSTPFNDTCLMTFFQKMTIHLKRYYTWEEMLYTTLYFIISISAVIGNGVVILAVIRKKEMRTNRNVFIVNLALSNLMLACTTIPFLWWPSIDFEFPYSKFFCKFANALPGSNIYCSTLTITVMAVDRYYSVKRINVILSERAQKIRSFLISLVIWVVSFLLSLPLLVYYDTTMLYVFKDVLVYDTSPTGNGSVVRRSYGWRQCRLSPGGASETQVSLDSDKVSRIPLDARAIQLLMSVLQVLFLYVVPLVVLLIFNMKLTRFLRFNAQQITRSRRGTLHRESVAPSPAKLHRSVGTNGVAATTAAVPPPAFVNCSRDSDDIVANGETQRWSFSNIPKISLTDPPCPMPLHNYNEGTKFFQQKQHSGLNGIQQQQQRQSLPHSFTSPSERAAEKRRSRTTALLVAMACSYAVLWFPFTLVSMLIDLEILHSENERVDQACKLISITSICVNPFLYGFLNTNFRHEFTDIFGSWMKCVAKLEQLLYWMRNRVTGVGASNDTNEENGGVRRRKRDDVYTSRQRHREKPSNSLMLSWRQTLYPNHAQSKALSTTLTTTLEETISTTTVAIVGDFTPLKHLSQQIRKNNNNETNSKNSNNNTNCGNYNDSINVDNEFVNNETFYGNDATARTVAAAATAAATSKASVVLASLRDDASMAHENRLLIVPEI